MIALDDMERVASDFFDKYCEPDIEADMAALIDYVTTLSKIHGKRISIFTVPETTERERYTRVDFGFGKDATLRLELKEKAQMAWLKIHGVEAFRQRYGKSYI